MINKVKHFIIKNSLLNKGDKVLVALSGGPDSVCLLHCLHMLKDEFDLEIGAAHVNHMLRGDEALSDEDYVRNLCESLDIECYIERIDIDRISKENGISHEMAGRDERYAFFERLKKKHRYTKVAIAHNANDQAETVIMRMMRGTGLDGLCGIRVKREGDIIRPILSLERHEIEEYCSINNLNPQIDKSNLEKIYSRNKIRLDILPYMQENFNEDIIKAINRMASILQKDNEYMDNESEKIYKKYCNYTNDELCLNNELFKLNEAIVTRVIKKAFIKYANTHNNFEMKHIYEVIELIKLGTNKKINLPNGIIAENIYGNIYLRKKISSLKKNNNQEVVLKRNQVENTSINFGDYKISFNVLSNKNNIEFSNNPLIKYFDYDNIKEGLSIRNRKDGDKIRLLGMKGTKKLKDIFIDLKIPRDKRDYIPILCFDNSIAWIIGHKVSEDFKVSKKTKNILKITFSREG